MDTTRVGIEAAHLMDVIAADDRLPEDAQIANVGLVVQIRVPVGEEEGYDDHEVIHIGCSSESRPFQVGLFTMAAQVAGESD